MPRFALEDTSRPGLLDELMRQFLCQTLMRNPEPLLFFFLAVCSAAHPTESKLLQSCGLE